MIFIAIWWSAMAAASLLVAREMRGSNSWIFVVLAILCAAVAYFCIP
ncbi:hypothetical protein UFOVP1414_31 [uncultured Caudovirales phage]|uniref:Uncharacterized protein n=1 Tax=uncultured Caudovirales phage TaxID=2100421 RepID=A0A6J5M6V2_9CAUD|nr:hypothetical protein UFOVP442_46 [uncultured Caudovirales phage]CAB4211840.1 hypothetical protein UFOVP1414_31 [uncultured Caudovirales phage]